MPEHFAAALSVFIAMMLSYRLPRLRDRIPFFRWTLISVLMSILNGDVFLCTFEVSLLNFRVN